MFTYIIHDCSISIPLYQIISIITTIVANIFPRLSSDPSQSLPHRIRLAPCPVKRALATSRTKSIYLRESTVARDDKRRAQNQPSRIVDMFWAANTCSSPNTSQDCCYFPTEVFLGNAMCLWLLESREKVWNSSVVKNRSSSSTAYTTSTACTTGNALS